MGRYSNLSTASFKPLDLQTIMMVPMAKQKQHDEAKLAASEYASLQAQSLGQDKDAVDARLGELRGDADRITSSLLDRGVDRNTMTSLQKLKREKDKEFSSEGLIGAAQSNYATASSFVKDLTEKKERQAGWSPSEAKKWAQSQVSAFKGTQGELGKFNTFSGKELEDYVDTNKWINDNIGKVAADTDPIMLQKYGGMSQFETAWKSGSVDHLDAAKIIKSLGIQAQYDHKLQASLKQSGAFSGEKDPANIGSYKIVKDKDGNQSQQFVPGSRFGMQLLGAATGAAYRREDAKFITSTDHVGIALYKQGLEDKAANDLVGAVKSGMMGIDPVNYDQLESSFAIATGELKTNQHNLKLYVNNWKEKHKDNPEGYRTQVGFMKLNQQNEDAGIKYSNAKNNLEVINEKANAGASKQQKLAMKGAALIDVQLDKLMANIPTIGDQVRGLFSWKDVKANYEEKNLKVLGLNDEQIGRIRAKTGMTEGLYRDAVKNQIMINNGYITADKKGDSQSEYQAITKFKEGSGNYRARAQAFLKDHPLTSDYETLSGESTGKYANLTGAAQKVLTDGFNANAGQGYTMANSGASIDAIREANPEATYALMPTTGLDINGSPIETMVMREKSGVFIGSYPVTRGSEGRAIQLQVANSLINSTAHKQKGLRMRNDLLVLPDLGGMGIHQKSFSAGVVPNQEFKDGTLPYIVKTPASEQGIETYTVFRIDKQKFLNSKGQEIVKIGSSGELGGRDQIVDLLAKSFQ
jgi:hypothetical protein